MLQLFLSLVLTILSFGTDLRLYWPGLTTHYISGENHEQWTVLWFEWQDQWTFHQFNSNPASSQSRCHFDELSWWDDGYLRYVRTVDSCGAIPKEIRYDPPIIVTPRLGDWSYTGQSTAIAKHDNQVVCTGTTSYTGTRTDMKVRTEQETYWETGSLPECTAGWTTRWAEEYTFGILPVEGGGSYRAMVTSQGGNLQFPEPEWDITFHRWEYLP